MVIKKIENKYEIIDNFTIDALISDVHFNEQTHWLGTNNGLYEIGLLGKELSFKHYNTSNSIAVSDIDIVFESNDTLLVCRKEDEQKIKQFVTDIKIEKGDKYV